MIMQIKLSSLTGGENHSSLDLNPALGASATGQNIAFGNFIVPNAAIMVHMRFALDTFDFACSANAKFASAWYL